MKIIRTMEVIKDIANDIDDMIALTIDVPSKHEDKKLPLLDLKVWLEKDEQIFFQFYEIPMKSRKVISR